MAVNGNAAIKRLHKPYRIYCYLVDGVTTPPFGSSSEQNFMQTIKENVVERWNVLWRGTKQELDSGQSDTSLLDNLLQALGTCDKDSFPNIHCLLVIACTLPISSAEAERSFSLLRKIKAYLRSTMSEECLSDLSVIAMHYGERV